MGFFSAYNVIKLIKVYSVRSCIVQVEMHDEIFHFEIFKNFMKILEYFKTPFLNIS